MKSRLNVKESSSGKDQIRMTYMKESGDEMKKEAVKMVQFIVQELAIKKIHQAYRIAAIVHIARLKPKSWFFESQSLTRGGLA